MEGLTLVSGLIGLITLICFFSLVVAVGDIRRMIKNPPKKLKYIDLYEEGELAEFLGKKEEAIERYRAARFYLSKISTPGDADKRNLQRVESKLRELDSFVLDGVKTI